MNQFRSWILCICLIAVLPFGRASALSSDKREKLSPEELAQFDKEQQEAREIVKYRGSYQVSFPADMPLQYIWSIPFERSNIRSDGLYIFPDSMLVHTTDNWIYHIRKSDGVVLWVVEMIGDFDDGIDPVITEQGVYVVILNEIFFIDRDEGKIIWKLEPNFPISTTPHIIEPLIYAPSWYGKFHCVRVKTRDRVLVPARKGQAVIMERIYQLRSVWQINTRGYVVQRPEYYKDVFYFGSEDWNIYSVTRDGRVRYRQRTQDKVLGRGRITPTKLYIGSNDFALYGLNRLTGRPDWKFVTGSFVTDQPYADIKASMVLAPSRNNGVYGLEDKGKSFEQLWYLRDAIRVVAVGPKLFYLQLTGKRLAAVEKKSGKIRWQSKYGRHFSTMATTPNDINRNEPMRLYAVTRDVPQVLVAFRERDADAGPWQPLAAKKKGKTEEVRY